MQPRVFVVVALAVVWAEAEKEACDDPPDPPPPPTPPSPPPSTPVQAAANVRLTNNYPHTLHVLWIPTGHGEPTLISSAEPGATAGVNSFAGHTLGWRNPDQPEKLIGRVLVQEGDHDVAMGDGSSTSPPSLPACKDRDSARCAPMAGQCMDAPGWMFVHCAATCGKCEMLDPYVRCNLSSFNMTSALPAVDDKPNGLNELFESMVRDAPGDVTVLSQPCTLPEGGCALPDGPWVITIDNFMSDEDMEGLLAETTDKMARSTDQGSQGADGEVEKKVTDRRTSQNAWCLHQCESNPGVHRILSSVEELTGMDHQHFEPFQVLRYEQTQKYSRHHDYVPKVNPLGPDPAGPRILTVFLYLSDVEEGGETAFTDLSPPLMVKPKRGRALVWPSVMVNDHLAQDPRTHHEARPIISGTKLAANTWIHLHGFRKPNLWGCTGSFTD